MTIMIPNTILQPNTPRGEKWLYSKLQSAPGTEDWICLHSFDIAKHVNKTSGEADMILLIPEAGVLFIEVKGVGVKRESGQWIYDDGRKPDAGPFVQSSTAMHSIRNKLASNREYSNLLYYSAVVFPDFDFNLVSNPLEWHDWQVADKKRLINFPIKDVFSSILEKAHNHMSTVGKAWYNPVTSRPTNELCKKLSKSLRPDFSMALSNRSAMEYVQKEIEEYTDEQLIALDALEGNPRTLVTGPAGTGKTVIAKEAFLRARSKGLSVLFLCFNQLLGKHLKDDLASIASDKDSIARCEVATFHSYLLKIAGIQPEKRAGKQFWTEDLPEIALNKILNDDVSLDILLSPDLIIVDEAQDLMLPAYLDCLEGIMQCGFKESSWLLLGDFKNQAIYEGSFENFEERVGENFTRYNLTRNCRNAGQIANQIKLVFGVQPEYRIMIPNLDGAEANVEFYSGQKNQAEVLESVLDKYSEVFLPDEIMVLSPRRNNVTTGGYLSKWKGRIEPIKYGSSSRNIRSSTISAYKGLESAVVVISDIEDLDDNQLKLLYVAISRAKVCVTVMINHKCKKRWAALLKEGMRR